MLDGDDAARHRCRRARFLDVPLHDVEFGGAGAWGAGSRTQHCATLSGPCHQIDGKDPIRARFIVLERASLEQLLRLLDRSQQAM